MYKNDLISKKLSTLGFDDSEAAIYLELLKKSATHAQLSLLTGINRTTLYRIVTGLEKRGLVSKCVNDQGKFLIAIEPAGLEADVITQEQQAKRQRAAFSQLLPRLENIRKGYEADFAVSTYEGVDGFKRMLWHELKAKGECLCLGVGPLEDLVPDPRWVAKHRQKTIEAGYIIREILQPDKKSPELARISAFFGRYYQVRFVSAEILPLQHLVAIYNDTVATYNVYEGRRIGLEITSRSYAQTARSIFELLWGTAIPG